MAKLYFYYSAMNAGKSTVLLQSSYNYHERGMDTLVLTPVIDTRYGVGKVVSRIGIEANAVSFDSNENLFEHARHVMRNEKQNLKCILIDEAQFLTKEQVNQLTEIPDRLHIPVLAYGLRTDFQGEPFPGSMYLLAWADELIEIKTICHCGSKAIMNMRVDENNNKITAGAQIEIGGNEKYIATCRKHFKTADAKNKSQVKENV